MPITSIYPASGDVVTTFTFTFLCKVEGWAAPPTAVRLLLGSGRISRYMTYNAETGFWEYDWDSRDAPTGAAGQPPTPYWNYPLAVQIEAMGGGEWEVSDAHWCFMKPYPHTPVDPATIDFRSELEWSPKFTTVPEIVEQYSVGEGSVGESMCTMVEDPDNPGRRFLLMRPDPSGDLRDQPGESTIRCQFSSPAVIEAGDDLYVGFAFRFTPETPWPKSADEHINLYQYYGQDSYDWDGDGGTYNMGTMFNMNLAAQVNPEDVPYVKDQGVLYTSGNKTNPGMFAPILYQRIVREKTYDIAFHLHVSDDVEESYVEAFFNDGTFDSLQPVRYPIAYPGTDNFYRIPFLLFTPYHSPQRTDIQAYGVRQSRAGDPPMPWPHAGVMVTGHKQGATLESVDPRSHPSPGLPAGYLMEPGFAVKLDKDTLLTHACPGAPAAEGH